MKFRTSLVVLGVLSLVLAACASATETPAPVVEPTAAPAAEPMANSIVDIAVEDGRFETLVAALQAADLTETLAGDGPFTVFAPTDDAFALLPEGTVEALLADIPQLTNILLYHVVSGEVLAADVVQLESAETLLGESVVIALDGDAVMLNESQVIITDIEASNGVIHVIDSVLLPPADEMADEGMMQSIVDIAVEDGRFTTLVAALQAADLAETLAGDGPFTVFAPTDDAFAMLPEGTVEALLADIPALSNILTYHVVGGQVLAADVVGLSSAETLQGQFLDIAADANGVMIDSSNVVITDILGSNGVIHVIDSVLLPESRSIVEIAVEDGRFTTLVAALQAAGLDDTLSGAGSFTVFAPTDDAFGKLPAGTIDALLADIPQLTDILLYHVVDGKVMAQDVVGLEDAETLQGTTFMILFDGGTVKLNGDSNVIITDIEAFNGVIHVIDSVLLPPA
jgi:transforming growth factor-beta-induced protein